MEEFWVTNFRWGNDGVECVPPHMAKPESLWNPVQKQHRVLSPVECVTVSCWEKGNHLFFHSAHRTAPYRGLYCYICHTGVIMFAYCFASLNQKFRGCRHNEVGEHRFSMLDSSPGTLVKDVEHDLFVHSELG